MRFASTSCEIRKFIVLLLVFMLPPVVVPVQAKEAVPMAENPLIEARMIKLAAELRCLVCQNESLAASRSDFAIDIRREMRDMMEKGKSDKEIIAFLVQRFGDFILFNPPMKSTTLLLWFGPLLLLAIAGSILLISLKRRRRTIETPLSDVAHKQAESLLARKDKEQ